MELFQSIFSQMWMDYQIPETTETKVLEFDERDPHTSLNSNNLKSEAIKENHLISKPFNNVSTLDNEDKTLLSSKSNCLEINNQNIKPELETVFSPENQKIKAIKNAGNFTDFVDVEYVNHNVNLSQITLDSILNNSFKPSNLQIDSVQCKTQTEFNVKKTDQYETYDDNIKELDMDMNGYNNMTDIVDLDECKRLLDFERNNDTTFIDKIKYVKDVIEGFAICNGLESITTEENEQEAILDNTNSKIVEPRGISDTNNKFTENLQNIVSDKESLISISSESGDELNDLKLTFSYPTDLETISLISLEEQIETGYINNDVMIENTTKDIQTVTLNSQHRPCSELKTFENVIDEAINDSVEKNCWKVLDDDNDFCSGYHSSDFEFITEDEAIETKLNDFTSNNTFKTIQISLDSEADGSDKTKEDKATKRVDNSSISYDYRNAAARYYNYNFSRQNINKDYSYRRNHVVPKGANYLNLFEGMFAPTVTCMLENKMTESSSMYVQYEGIGFDMRAVQDQDSDSELEEAAKQSASKILSIYPSENRKRRRF